MIRVLWPDRYESVDTPCKGKWSYGRTAAPGFLLDAGSQGGGHGVSLDWTSLASLSSPRPWFLAGGLSSASLNRALEQCSPDGIDLNSGVEAIPGQKKLRKNCQGPQTTHSLHSLLTSHEERRIFRQFRRPVVPEALRPPLMELEEAMDSIMPSREYRDALQDLLVNYAGRETPLTFCPHLSEKLGFRLWLKREDLLHTGAHKINNALGQALAKMMGKTHLIAETGGGAARRGYGYGGRPA